MLNLRLLKIRKPGIVRDQSGFTLVEVVIAIALLGIVAAGLFTGLGTTSKVLLHTDARETAKNLAETQMEFVKGQIYTPGSGTAVYTPAPIPPAQQGAYTASIEVFDGLSLVPPRDGYLQKIVVTITGPGITYTLEGYKVK
jgi:prepilin-type N-terminal cleavage/methylation domain-containing protein